MTLAAATDTALILGAIAAIIVAISGAIAQMVNSYILVRGQSKIAAKVDDVHHEVTTLNGKTIAVIADEGETRRIENIPEDDRSVADQAHLDAMPTPKAE